MNVFWHELRANRKSTLIWSLSLAGFMILYLSFYPSFANDTEQFTKIMEGYPEAVRNALGMNLGIMFTVLGFYTFPLTFVTLCAAIQAMNLGTSIVNKEVREKTADFLLTKPVSRQAVLTSKLLSALVSLVITNFCLWIAAFVTLNQVKTTKFDLETFFLLSVTVLFVQLIFLALGVFVSVLFQKIKSVLAVSLPTVFGFYFLAAFFDTSGNDMKRYFSPFDYFDTVYIMKNAKFEWEYLIAGACVVVVSVVASFVIYRKKDIHSV